MTEKDADQLPHLRHEIDQLDAAITTLLRQRLELCGQVGAAKLQQGLPVFDASRENEVLAQVTSRAQDPLVATKLAEIYQAILAASRSLQMELTLSQDKLDKPAYFPDVAIIGLGLIGGMLAAAIRRVMPGTTIIACDRPAIIGEALTAGLIDRGTTQAEEAANSAALVILAAGPDANLELLRELAPVLRRRQVVLDVTSTKSRIVSLASELNLKADFIGGHPLIGSHKSGWRAGQSLVVRGETFALVPVSPASELAVRRLTRWLQQLGFTPVVTAAETHDAALARTSHLVQLMAVCLGTELGRGQNDAALAERLVLSGPALRELARLMASPSRMWLEIAEQNQKELAQATDDVARQLRQLAKALAFADTAPLAAAFAEASRVSAVLGGIMPPGAGAPESTHAEHSKQTYQASADAGKQVRSSNLQ